MIYFGLSDGVFEDCFCVFFRRCLEAEGVVLWNVGVEFFFPPPLFREGVTASRWCAEVGLFVGIFIGGRRCSP